MSEPRTEPVTDVDTAPEASQTQAPETEAPETEAPESEAAETEAAETEAPEDVVDTDEVAAPTEPVAESDADDGRRQRRQ